MEYKIIHSSNPTELSSKVNEMVQLGWQPKGSHKVVIVRKVNRYSGTQHMDTQCSSEYSQTMVKKTRIEVDKNLVL